MHYQELNKVIPPLHITVLSVEDLMVCFSKGLDICHFVVDLTNAFFYIDIAL